MATRGDWDSASLAQLDALRAIEALTGVDTGITAWRLLRLARVGLRTLRSLHRAGWVRVADDIIGPNSSVILTTAGREIASDYARRHGAYDGPRELDADSQPKSKTDEMVESLYDKWDNSALKREDIRAALEDAYQRGREDALDEHECPSFGDRHLNE